MAELRLGTLERRLKQTKPMPDGGLRLVVNLQVATAHLEADLESHMAAEDISLPAYNLLRILRGRPDGHSRNAIRERLVYRNADVTRIVDRLERRGLVERLREARDRRMSITRITAKGLKVLGRLDPMMNAMADTYRRKLSLRDLAELNRLLELLYLEHVE